MTTRPKTQEYLLKSKSVMPSGDMVTENTSDSSPPNQHEKAVAEISMQDFLDFLKISYQVNEAIDNPTCEINEKIAVDWRKLTADILIKRLNERAKTLKNAKGNKKQETECKKSESCLNYENLEAFGTSSRNSSKPNTESKSIVSLVDSKSSHKNTTILELSPEKPLSTVSLDRKFLSDKHKRNATTRKKSHTLKKESSGESETSKLFDDCEDDGSPSMLLKKKLNDILQEGILDSVLPYLLPKQLQQQIQGNSQFSKKPGNDPKKPGSGSGHLEKRESVSRDKTDSKRKSLSNYEKSSKIDKTDMEVVIHVCDEMKNLKKDFKCSQKLLISQMGYFAQVTNGQKLEDMDISVHCDVMIFEWLMKWVQKDYYPEDQWPVLDCSIVVPVLMSSDFLQMYPLEEHCLMFCKKNINDIIRESSNLNCINDTVLTRLTKLFSNTEIDAIIDKKDKIQSKLFCKLIATLTEPEPLHPQRGHFSSLATVFRCLLCQKIILKKYAAFIICLPSNMIMDRNGSVLSTHKYDNTWNLSGYIKDLKAELKTWRKVYWKLWADCHLLHCQSCEEFFPVYQMHWCRFHLDTIQYFPLENQKSVFHPVGKYSCCGERAYRFEILKKVSGCHYRDHVPLIKTTEESEILHIWNLHRDLIKLDPPPIPPSDYTKTGRCKDDLKDSGRRSPEKNLHWWEGIELAPLKPAPGLLSKLWDNVIKKDYSKNDRNSTDGKSQKSLNVKCMSAPQPSVPDMSSFSDSSDESCDSSIAANSEESCHSTTKIASRTKPSVSSHYLASSRLSHVRREKKKKKKKKKRLGAKSEGNCFWLSKLSTRSNQDNQREFEERALRQIESILAKKLSGETFRCGGSRSGYQVNPPGGVYVRLEQEWREAHCFSHGCPGSSIKAKVSGSYTSVNHSNILKRSKSRSQRL